MNLGYIVNWNNTVKIWKKIPGGGGGGLSYERGRDAVFFMSHNFFFLLAFIEVCLLYERNNLASSSSFSQLYIFSVYATNCSSTITITMNCRVQNYWMLICCNRGYFVLIFLSPRAKLLTPGWLRGENTLLTTNQLYILLVSSLCPKIKSFLRFFGAGLFKPKLFVPKIRGN